MRRHTDDDYPGITPVDIWPPYTVAERIEVEYMTDPRRDWPTLAEAKADLESSPVEQSSDADTGPDGSDGATDP